MHCLRISEWGKAVGKATLAFHIKILSSRDPGSLKTLQIYPYKRRVDGGEWGRGRGKRRMREGGKNEKERMPGGPCFCRESQIDATASAWSRWRKVASAPRKWVCLIREGGGDSAGKCSPPLRGRPLGPPFPQPPPSLLLHPSVFPLPTDSNVWMLCHRAVVQRAAGRGRGQGALWQEAARTSWPFRGQNKFSLGFGKDKASKLPLLCRMRRTNHEPEPGCRLTAAAATTVSSSSCQELSVRGKGPRGGRAPLEGAQPGRGSSGAAWGRRSRESWGRAWTSPYSPAWSGKGVGQRRCGCAWVRVCVCVPTSVSGRREISGHRSVARVREAKGWTSTSRPPERPVSSANHLYLSSGLRICFCLGAP